MNYYIRRNDITNTMSIRRYKRSTIRRARTRGGYTAKPYYPRGYRKVSPRGYGNFSGMGEMKFVTFKNTSDNFSAAWASMMVGDNVSNMAQGDTGSTRDGRVYHIHSVHCKFVIFADNAVGTTAPADDFRGRVVLVLDKQTNGLVVAPLNVMDTVGGDQTLSFRNLQFSGRYQILFDRSWMLERNPMSEGGQDFFASGSDTTPIFKYNRRFTPPIKVICNGTGATIANVTDFSISVIGVANITGGILNMTTRVRFTG